MEKNQSIIERLEKPLRSETFVVDGVPMDFIIIENFTFSALDEDFIARLSDLNPRQFMYPGTCHVREAKINDASMHVASNPRYQHMVTMNYSTSDQKLTTSCDCQIETKKICIHQAIALYCILAYDELHMYFYPEKRNVLLKATATKYGMESVDNLEDYFDLDLRYGQPHVVPKMKELLPLDERGQQKLNQLLPTPKAVFSEKRIKRNEVETFKGLSFSFNPYYSELKLNLFEYVCTKDGRPKNPFNTIDPNLAIQNCSDGESIKVYAAILFFKGVYHREKEIEPQLKALRTILEGNLNVSYFFSNHEHGTITSAKYLTLAQIRITDNAYIELEINQKKDFFEILPFLVINDKPIAFQFTKIHQRFFIEAEGEVHLFSGAEKYQLLHFFKEHNNRLLIPAAQYEAFQQTYLAPLEQEVKIKYSFVKQPTPKQIAFFSGVKNIEKTIYLSESENYILITPAVRYGKVEVPILVNKQIIALDEIGESYHLPRDKDLENQFLSVLLRQHDHFEEQLNEFEHFYLHKQTFYSEGWFVQAFAEWNDLGIQVLGFKELKGNKWNSNKIAVKINVSSGIDWFDTQIKMKFGNEEVSLLQVQKAIKNQRNYVVLGDGTHGLLPEEWIQKFNNYFRSGDLVDDSIRISKVNYGLINELFVQEELDKQVMKDIEHLKNRIRDFREIKHVSTPALLQAELRGYQKEGLNWMHFLDEFNFGGCLADDMGLGKTIQVISFMLSLKEKRDTGTHLVVLPTTLLFNWTRELEKFAPSLRVHVNYGQTRAKKINHFADYDVVLTTYGVLISDIGQLKKFAFDYVFLDESQAIKNPESLRYKAARLLQARNRMVLTGTPIENNTFDLFAQFSFAVPGIFGSMKNFRDQYSTPIDKFKDIGRAKELQNKINPFLLRRTKKQVATELPDKTEMILHCEMGDEQRKIYDAHRLKIREQLLEESGIQRNMALLAGLTKLRQICDSPKIIPDDADYGSESAKLNVLMEEIHNKHRNHKILVFSQFVSMLDLIQEELDKAEISHEYLTGKSRNREEIVHRFQNDEEVRVFLISLKAGGVGLNLTEADYVYIVDPWWNPAVENQAIDRSYRIGQKKNVVAIRLICPNTIEDKILNLQASKKELAEDLVRTDASVLKVLSQENLLELFD